MWSGHLWMGGMWIFPLIIFIAVIAILFAIFNRSDYPVQDKSGEYYSTGRRSETAQEILKKRFAKGEITKEEFETMKHDINS
ncbi:MAG: SHOCT domain-containing protein [Planctomycetia bacterium]|nr:SHOCT domain-containing protein [Planctomycetia bacterium]